MSTELGSSEDALANQLVLGLAAHPLSSCNPPPPEIPDLLDSLIASEARLEEQVAVIDNVGKGLVRRGEDLKKRLQQLRAAHSHLKAQANTADPKHNNELLTRHLILEAQDRVLQKMCIQIMFLHATFTQKVRGMTISTIKAHRDIFAEFLGERHNHPGMQIANSSTLSCAPGCDWYQKHGPYEWSKKPYTNAWWEEMNQTNWDWLRMREHFAAAVTVGGGKVMAMYQMLQTNSTSFIPGWFWSEDFETWTLHGSMEPVASSGGDMERQVVVKVRYNKSQAEMNQEKVKKMQEMKTKGLHDSTNPTDVAAVDVDKVGETIIDKAFVFDGLASNSGHGQVGIRWLMWWGFEKWNAERIKVRSGEQVISNR